jgi:tetratricopeptide (TPR) repeat protein
MPPSPNAPARRRIDAYFAASVEVARRLADGTGGEAIAVLRRELERTRGTDDVTGRRFLLSQIALCHARMNDVDSARRSLEEIEEELPREAETALMLAEGYLLLLDNTERASHHAALALQWAEEESEGGPELISRGHTLMARALLRGNDLLGAFGAWQGAPLPDWRVAVELIEAGYDPSRIRGVLVDALPRHVDHERRAAAAAVAASDQIQRLLAWIDAGCPRRHRS